MRLLRIVPLVLLVPAALSAQTVRMVDGNLVYQASANAAPRQLTSGGLDRDPVLSPDGRAIAFIRGTPGDTVEILIGPEEATALWTVRVDGSGARMLLRGRVAETAGQALAQLQGPRFSSDGERIYFLSAAWANTAAVHVVEVATGAEQFLVAGNSLDVVPSGRFAGHLIVSQHRYFLAGGSYDWYWLVTPNGDVVDPVGETEESLEELRAMYVDP